MTSDNQKLFEYTYDAKNGIFKNVLYASLLFLEVPYEFFCPTSNNWLSQKNIPMPKEHIDFTYTYNADEYPSQMIVNGPDGKIT